MCHSTKRTHFVFASFPIYRFYIQRLTPFAVAFANGFVSEKRTHFGVDVGDLFMAFGVRLLRQVQRAASCQIPLRPGPRLPSAATAAICFKYVFLPNEPTVFWMEKW